jgi:IMP dehydrogenase
MMNLSKRYFYQTSVLNVCFADVCLVTGLSTVKSRSDVDTSLKLTEHLTLDVPIIAAAMDTITSPKMAETLLIMGAGIVHHRNQSVEERARALHHGASFMRENSMNGVAVGLKATEKEIEYYIESGANLICLEVAHAYMTATVDVVNLIHKVIQRKNPKVALMVGNFSNPRFLWWLNEQVGNKVDLVKPSQGGGSCCTTRVVAGIGKPTLQAVMDAQNAILTYNLPYKIVADGGVRSSGDVAKAIGAGASAVMVGRLLSGTDEAPGALVSVDGKKYKTFRGMASAAAKSDSEEISYANVEGVSFMVEYKGEAGSIVRQVKDGLQSGIASSGFTKAEDFRNKAKFILLSSASQTESRPHIKEG